MPPQPPSRSSCTADIGSADALRPAPSPQSNNKAQQKGLCIRLSTNPTNGRDADRMTG